VLPLRTISCRKDHFVGDVERVVNFFRFVAEETREWMAMLGVSKLEDLIGRVDLLEHLDGVTEKQHSLNLHPITWTDDTAIDQPQFCEVERNPPFDRGEKAAFILSEVLPAIEAHQGGEFEFSLTNCDRSIGARISGEIAKRYGNEGMEAMPVVLRLSGTAGQSFGVWNAGGLHMYLGGDCNDYVGKGMAGGKLVIYPPKGSRFESRDASIIGNTLPLRCYGRSTICLGVCGRAFRGA
jgi:glutamate synthase (NADPH/NADH) large chain